MLCSHCELCSLSGADAARALQVANALGLKVPAEATWGNESSLTLTQRSTGHLGLLDKTIGGYA